MAPPAPRWLADTLGSFAAEHSALAVLGREGLRATVGEAERRFRLASVSKLLTAYAVLVAFEEGTITLDEAAGPPGATVAHLLAHASGLGTEGRVPLAPPGERRIYSNGGFEALAAHLEQRSGIVFADYLAEAVLAPLGMGATTLAGSPAHGAVASLEDLVAFAAELLAPRLVSVETLAAATTVAFPGLVGVLPGFGRQDPCDWGLGFEVRDHKAPHWTGAHNAASSFGHFGQSGTFLLVDPEAALSVVLLTDRPFDEWAARGWPPLLDGILGDPALALPPG